MAQDEIAKAPREILSRKTREVKKVDEKIATLAKRMFEVMERQDGVGLAAPQVGSDLRVAVIGFEPTEEQKRRDNTLAAIPKIALINPRIISRARKKTAVKERCLSAPGEEVVVERSEKVVVEYLDLEGKRRRLKARGLLARVVQHELDHLDGKIITDYRR